MKKIIIKSIGLVCGTSFIISVILGILGLLGMFVEFLCDNPFWSGVFITVFFIWFIKEIKKEIEKGV